jgi:methionine-S-sulfoxide reductase
MRKISTIAVLLTALLSLPLQAADKGLETAILAGGCFWCIESDYEKLDGVVDVVSGYTGGELLNPSYEQVSSGTSGHIESVEVTYDPRKIDYAGILDYFWRHIDPTRDDGQFCDKGPQYRPAIFYRDAAQKTLAEKSKAEIEKTKPFAEPIKVELIPASTFYPAEEYHQDYYKKNPLRYRFYRYSCGRDKRVEQLWGQS